MNDYHTLSGQNPAYRLAVPIILTQRATVLVISMNASTGSGQDSAQEWVSIILYNKFPRRFSWNRECFDRLSTSSREYRY